jgi:hypothetical protein
MQYRYRKTGYEKMEIHSADATNRSINQSISQSISQSTNQPNTPVYHLREKHNSLHSDVAGSDLGLAAAAAAA